MTKYRLTFTVDVWAPEKSPKDFTLEGFQEALGGVLNAWEDGRSNLAMEAFCGLLGGFLRHAVANAIAKVLFKRYGNRMVNTGPGRSSSVSHLLSERRTDKYPLHVCGSKFVSVQDVTGEPHEE